MSSEEATVAVIDALGALSVPYMLVGSFSSNFYGVPRATQDVDFVLQIEGHSIAAIIERLGPRFRLDPQISFETVTATTRYVVEVVDAGAFQIEFFLLSEDAHDQQRFARRRCVEVLHRKVFVPTAEDVIITKLRWSGHAAASKHIDDVRSVIAVQGDRIQWDYVRSWCDQHGTRDLLEEIRRRLPPL